MGKNLQIILFFSVRISNNFHGEFLMYDEKPIVIVIVFMKLAKK